MIIVKCICFSLHFMDASILFVLKVFFTFELNVDTRKCIWKLLTIMARLCVIETWLYLLLFMHNKPPYF